VIVISCNFGITGTDISVVLKIIFMKKSFVPFRQHRYSVKEISNCVYSYFKSSYQSFASRLAFLRNGSSDFIEDRQDKQPLPINNFIKDTATIDRGFLEEEQQHKEHCILIDGELVPVSRILKRPMEENY
jgi:hypothetical protein